MSNSASRREIVAHAERMADEHIPAWRHMAVVTKKMEHWSEEPTGGEMDELVDAYGAMHTEKQIREQGLIDSSTQNPRSFEPSQEAAQYPLPEDEASDSEPEPDTHEPTEEQLEQEQTVDPELAALQKELDDMNLEQANLFAPLSDSADQDPTGAKMKLSKDPTPRVTFSHSPYHHGKTQGLFSSGHVNESKSITELKLTMMSIENRLAILRASPNFDAHSADIERATLLVEQSERP